MHQPTLGLSYPATGAGCPRMQCVGTAHWRWCCGRAASPSTLKRPPGWVPASGRPPRASLRQLDVCAGLKGRATCRHRPKNHRDASRRPVSPWRSLHRHRLVWPQVGKVLALVKQLDRPAPHAGTRETKLTSTRLSRAEAISASSLARTSASVRCSPAPPPPSSSSDPSFAWSAAIVKQRRR